MQERSRRPRDCMMEVVKDLTCPICLEFYSHPIILPCSHVMCKQPCAENVFEGNFIRCPVCRDNCYVSGGISSLPRVITIESIIEKIRADRKKRIAARHAQRNDDASTEMTPESWSHKTSLDDLFSDIASERLSPDDVQPRTTVPMATNGQTTGQSTPAMCFSPNNASQSLSSSQIMTSARSNQSENYDIFENSPPTLSTPPTTMTTIQNNNSNNDNNNNNILSRRFSREGWPISSQFSPISTSSNCGSPRYQGGSQNSTDTIGESSSTQSHSRFLHRDYTASELALRNTLVIQRSGQTSSHAYSSDLNTYSNVSLTRSRSNNSRTVYNIADSDTTNSMHNPRPYDPVGNSISSQSLWSHNNNMINIRPSLVVKSPRGSQSAAGDLDIGESHTSTRFHNIRLNHERSIANLQACSNSIRDLQNEYLTFTHRIQNNTPRARSGSSGDSVDNVDAMHHHPETNNDGSLSLASRTVPATQTSSPSPSSSTSSSSSSSSSSSIASATQAPTYDLDSVMAPPIGQGHSLPKTIEENGRGQMSRNSSVVPFFKLADQDVNVEAIGPRYISCGGDAMEIQSRLRDTEGGAENATSDVLPAGCDVTSMTSNRKSVADLKLLLHSQMEKLCNAQCLLVEHMGSFRSQAHREQSLVDREREEINKECDALVAEIENKRAIFLLHLVDQESNGDLNLSDVTVAMETLLESTQQLAQFVAHMLESESEVLLNTASNVFDKISRAVHECETCLQESVSTLANIEDPMYAISVGDFDYIEAPSRPGIDTERCSRNAHAVALFLAPPPSGDVIDHYEVCYCSEEQKNLGIEERYYAKNSPSESDDYDVTSRPFPVLLIENLCMNTQYYFCVCTVNRRGRSQYSDYVQCVTLGEHDCVVPVPTIMEKLSHASTTSIKMVCPSLATVTAHQEVRHYILQRKEIGAFVWQGAELNHLEEELLVTRLHPQTQYYFIVMACNRRGECQLSHVSTFHTTSETDTCIDLL